MIQLFVPERLDLKFIYNIECEGSDRVRRYHSDHLREATQRGKRPHKLVLGLCLGIGDGTDRVPKCQPMGSGDLMYWGVPVRRHEELDHAAHITFDGCASL